MTDDYAVSWFEEPVSSDDLAGLREIRDQCEADIAAGEYGYDLTYFAPLVTAGAVDCVQVDVTRCGGYTDWLAIAQLAAAHGLHLSAHCAPNLHAHVAVAVPGSVTSSTSTITSDRRTALRRGSRTCGGLSAPSRDRPGHGMTLRHEAAPTYRIA